MTAPDVPGGLSSALRRVLLIAGLLALLGVLAALVIGGELRETITRPFLYVAWLVGLLFRGFPEAAIWAVLVTTGVILAVASLGGERAELRRLPQAPAHVPGQVEQLAGWLAEPPVARYFKRQVARRVLNLTLHTRGYYEPLGARAVEQLLEDGLELPPELREVVAGQARLAHLGSLESMSRPRWQFFANLRETFFPARRAGGPPAEIDPALVQLVDHLESELEYVHEHRD